jgi:hypothetical protein
MRTRTDPWRWCRALYDATPKGWEVVHADCAAQAKHTSNQIKGPPLVARLLFDGQFSAPGAEGRLSEREATVAP